MMTKANDRPEETGGRVARLGGWEGIGAGLGCCDTTADGKTAETTALPLIECIPSAPSFAIVVGGWAKGL